jgi:hypothetical protein
MAVVFDDVHAMPAVFVEVGQNFMFGTVATSAMRLGHGVFLSHGSDNGFESATPEIPQSESGSRA